MKCLLTNRQDLLNRNIQKTLYKQHQDGIEVRITYLEDLQLICDEVRIKNLDFAIYNDALITDRTSDNGNYFGKRTTNPVETKKYLRLFDLINVHSHRFSSENIQSQLQHVSTTPPAIPDSQISRVRF